jgi:uncharacterized membrane protein
MFTVGLVTVPENVTGAPELQVIACEVGLTELVGVVVKMLIVTTCIVKHPVAGSVAVTVMLLAAVIPTVAVFAVKDGLDQK